MWRLPDTSSSSCRADVRCLAREYRDFAGGGQMNPFDQADTLIESHEWRRCGGGGDAESIWIDYQKDERTMRLTFAPVLVTARIGGLVFCGPATPRCFAEFESWLTAQH